MFHGAAAYYVRGSVPSEIHNSGGQPGQRVTVNLSVLCGKSLQAPSLKPQAQDTIDDVQTCPISVFPEISESKVGVPIYVSSSNNLKEILSLD